MGASDFAYTLARRFGLNRAARPALVPFTLGGEDVLFRGVGRIREVVSAPAGSGASFAGNFHHLGLSGHAAGLQLLAASGTVDFFDERADLLERKRQASQTDITALFREHLPERLARVLADRRVCQGRCRALRTRRYARRAS